MPKVTWGRRKPCSAISSLSHLKLAHSWYTDRGSSSDQGEGSLDLFFQFVADNSTRDSLARVQEITFEC